MEVLLDVAKYGVSGVAIALVVALIVLMNNNLKERTGNARERFESQKVMAQAISDLRTSIEKSNKLADEGIAVSRQIYEYLKIRNGIADKSSMALAHALERLGVKQQ